jgi:hypothetical protein
MAFHLSPSGVCSLLLAQGIGPEWNHLDKETARLFSGTFYSVLAFSYQMTL